MKNLVSIMVVFLICGCDVVINIQQKEPTKEVEVAVIPIPTQPMGRIFTTSELPEPDPGYHWIIINEDAACIVYGCDHQTCEYRKPNWAQVKDYDFHAFIPPSAEFLIHGATIIIDDGSLLWEK